MTYTYLILAASTTWIMSSRISVVAVPEPAVMPLLATRVLVKTSPTLKVLGMTYASRLSLRIRRG